MRFPSISLVVADAGRVFRRFPLVVVTGLLAAAAAVAMVEEPEASERYLRLLAVASLGLPLLTGLALLVERGRRSFTGGARETGGGWAPVAAGLLHLAGIVVLAGIYLAWPSWRDPVALRRYLQLSLAFHLLVAFLPYFRTGERNGFWQYNKTLFIRFLTAALYSHVLFAGLSVAMLALDKLFGVNVKGERYEELWIVIGFLFTTWFFLGGIPRNLDDLEAVADYPRGLRVFSQFILVPLVSVYMILLTLYLGKVAITRIWPSGWIGYLVSSVSVAGILSLLLVAPVRERSENAWIATYSRGFYILLLPSIGMLLLSIGKRVSQYGVTENRYFLIVLSVWLALVALYFIFSRAGNIKVIPATLCAVTVLTLGGPWGAYAVSARSQTHRLAGLLERNDMLADGKVRAATGSVSFDDRREMSAVLSYLLETHGPASIEDWFPGGLAEADTLDTTYRTGDRWMANARAKRILDDLNVSYVEKWEQLQREGFFSLPPRIGKPSVFAVAGFDYAIPINQVDTPEFRAAGRSLRTDYAMRTVSLQILEGRSLLIELPLEPVVEWARKRSQDPGAMNPMAMTDSLWSVSAENDRMAARLAVTSLSGHDDEAGPRLTSLNGQLLIRFKP